MHAACLAFSVEAGVWVPPGAATLQLFFCCFGPSGIVPSCSHEKEQFRHERGAQRAKQHPCSTRRRFPAVQNTGTNVSTAGHVMAPRIGGVVVISAGEGKQCHHHAITDQHRIPGVLACCRPGYQCRPSCEPRYAHQSS
eukprot:358404-Chlamydomonas_euryale.AAC.16